MLISREIPLYNVFLKFLSGNGMLIEFDKQVILQHSAF